MDYRRMGNMELNVGNTTSATSMDQWRHQWKSPRWIVLRIEALVLVTIILSFILAAFGSCRRWSNRWIVQKGFFIAQALSLSLATYSMGLMQSSSVKSEMYPIWTVSLFTLFSCIDPITSYNGLDYKGPLLKIVYGNCLYCGYVLLISISALSRNALKTAIIMLSAITFIKGMHRSLALVHQRSMRSMLKEIDTYYTTRFCVSRRELWSCMVVDHGGHDVICIDDIEELTKRKLKDERLSCCYVACVALGLSHELQLHILGLVGPRRREPDPDHLRGNDYKWAMRVIEIELAFVYESLFSGNPFLYYYKAKTASFWALASFIGICFVGIAVAASTPGHHGGSTSTNVVETTTADLVITFLVLASLALLQLMHLIWSCISYWARVSVACACARKEVELTEIYDDDHMCKGCAWWLRLKMSVATSTNWFDKYLWQDKIGQCSVIRDGRVLPTIPLDDDSSDEKEKAGTNSRLDILVKMLGLDYIWDVLRDLLGLGGDTKAAGIRLDDDIKASVIEFLATIETSRLDKRWFGFQILERVRKREPGDNPTLKYYIQCVLAWQAATWLCQIAEAEQEKQDAVNKSEEQRQAGRRQAAVYYLNRAYSAVEGCFRKSVAGEGRDEKRDRRVAIALSNYCNYLMVSAPELLPGSISPDTMKRLFVDNAKMVKTASIVRGTLHQFLEEHGNMGDWGTMVNMFASPERDDYGIELLVYAAPYGKVEAHMQHLAQGGEFITHLWALLYHLNIREWQPAPEKNQNLHGITTTEEAERILAKDDMAVVAFLSSLSGHPSDELATASKLEDGVPFFQTTSRDVFRHFMNPDVGRPALMLLNKNAKEKLTLYYGSFRAYDIAYFVTSNKRAFAKTRVQETASSSVDNPIKKQSSEDGGQTEDEIEEESSAGGGGLGQTKDVYDAEMLS